MGTWLNRGAPPAAWQGPSIERNQNSPKNRPHAAFPTTPDLFTLMRVDEAEPSRNLINDRRQPTAIGARAQKFTIVVSSGIGSFRLKRAKLRSEAIS